MKNICFTFAHCCFLVLCFGAGAGAAELNAIFRNPGPQETATDFLKWNQWQNRLAFFSQIESPRYGRNPEAEAVLLAHAWLERRPPQRFSEVGEKSLQELLPVEQTEPVLLAKVRGTKIYHLRFRDDLEETLMFLRLYKFIEAPRHLGHLGNDFATLKDLAEKGAGLVGGGHDYSANDLARFFNKMTEKGFPLNRWELLLRNELVRLGTLKSDGKGIMSAAQNVAVVATCVEEGERETLDHEINHGIYFTDSGYRRQVDSLFQNIQGEDLEVVRRVVEGRVYDSENPSLLAREFAAFFREASVPSDVRLEGGRLKAFRLHQAVRELNRHAQLYRRGQN